MTRDQELGLFEKIERLEKILRVYEETIIDLQIKIAELKAQNESQAETAPKNL
jgi:FtsZ-binding cell division protein ZapB